MFVRESDFDTNGVLHLLGTRGRTVPYTNPQTTGRVIVTVSSLLAGPYNLDGVGGFIDHARPTAQNQNGNWTNNAAGSFVVVQLPLPLVATEYTVRHGNSAGYALRNWNLEGSNDGVDWVVLRQHVNDTTLTVAEYSTATWDVNNPDRLAFSRFRIITTGFDSSGTQYLSMAGLELYGRVPGGTVAV